MEHPFFDVISFPANRDEAKNLHRVLALAEQDGERIRLIYTQSGSNDLPPLTLPRAADLVWDEVMRNLTSRGFFKSFCDLVKTRFSNAKPILDAVTAVEDAKPTHEIKIYSGDIYILDRDSHRQALSQIAADTTAAKVMLIRGNTKSGKSHCRYIFNALAEEKGAIVIYMCDGIVWDVQSTIEYIFNSFGAADDEIPVQGLTSDEAWYMAVCSKLKKIATEKNQKAWIVMDDLGYVETMNDAGVLEKGPILDTRIRKFFEQFARFMLDTSFTKYFRLLLIHYSEESAPTKWKAEMWIEATVVDNDIDQTHVEEFLRSWSGPKTTTLLEADIKDLAAEVISGADNPSPENAKLTRLEIIYKILKARLDEILKNARNDH